MIGLLSRFAALGMIAFVWVQTIVDVTGHGAALGSYLTAAPNVLDQRTLWTFVLLVIVINGAGPLSVDRILRIK